MTKPITVDEDRDKEILGMEDFQLELELGIGEAQARYWTCDFSSVSFFSVRFSCVCFY